MFRPKSDLKHKLKTVQKCPKSSTRNLCKTKTNEIAVADSSVFVQVENCNIHFDNCDSVGLSLHSLAMAQIDGVRVVTTDLSDRALAIGEGVVLSENLKQNVTDVEVTGMRIGK